jgi:hypothetical protein
MTKGSRSRAMHSTAVLLGVVLVAGLLLAGFNMRRVGTLASPTDNAMKTCADLAREGSRDVPFDTSYDPENHRVFVYQDGNSYELDVDSPSCRSQSPWVKQILDEEQKEYSEHQVGECASLRTLQASGATRAHGKKIDRAALERYVAETCQGR